MLYCPECQKTYEDAVQRFCLNDGRRLIRALSDDASSNRAGGVFTKILNRKTETETDKFVAAPRFSKAKFRAPADSDFLPPFEAEIFEVNATEQPTEAIESAFEAVPLPESAFETTDETSAIIEDQIEAETEIQTAPEVEAETETLTPLEIQPEIEEEKSSPIETAPSLEIPQGIALSDDGKTHSTSRKILTWENPSALVEQTIKNRYFIIEQTGKDESGIVYLAEDKTAANKKVAVHVLMDEDANDSFTNKVYAEERVALSNINHPNIAGVLDSGELSDGKPFIVSESVEGKSIEKLLENGERFDAERVARIVREAANALSEVHQSGILHRNLNPKNIVLIVNDENSEQVKLTDFGAAKNKPNEANLLYKSPEQIEGKLANVTSDEYALAIIAFQMLTGKVPFKAARSTGKLLKARREGLKTGVIGSRLDLPATANQILEKALAFDASERYPKASDFGEAFYNAVFADANLKADKSSAVETINESPVLIPETPLTTEPESLIDGAAQTTQTKPVEEEIIAKIPQQTEPKSNRALVAVFGAAILLLGVWGIWSLFLNRADEEKRIVQNPPVITNAANQTITNSPEIAVNNSPTAETIETAPSPRPISQPPNTNYFLNDKANLKDESLKNYLGFSLYYPKDWKVNQINGGNAETKTRGTFLDISKNAPSGTPIEQMIVSYYESSGTFQADTENFAKQIIETNRALSKIIPNYAVVSKGEQTINGGKQVYELKFQGTGTTPAGEKINLWGKRLFVPAAKEGVKNGYMITMLATSLSNDVKSVEDVGAKGDLPRILSTFEPNQTF